MKNGMACPYGEKDVNEIKAAAGEKGKREREKKKRFLQSAVAVPGKESGVYCFFLTHL